nr:solute carrier family 23 member 3 isoform X2 [Anser cygnoides]
MNGGRRRATGAGSPALAARSPPKMCSRVLSCCLGLQVRGDCSERPERRDDGRGLGPPRAAGRGSCRTKIAGGSAPGVPGGEGTAGRAGRPRRVLRHGVSRPPILFPTQHLAVQASLLCAFHLLLLPALPEGQPRAPAAGELLARSLFACGVSALLQTSLGSRLPLVQIPSFEYLVPAVVLSSHLSRADRNGTAVAIACPAPHCAVTGSQAASLREVSGAVVVSGLTQLALGMSGVCGWAARRCGPMVLAPSLSIIGLSAYKEAAFLCSASWGVALLYVSPGAAAGTGRPRGARHAFGAPSPWHCVVTCAPFPRLMLLTVTFSQHLGSCRLPFCARPRAPGGSVEPAVPTLRTLSVLLPFAAVCIVCAILQHLRVPWDSLDAAAARFPWANSTFHPPWLQLPYSGGTAAGPGEAVAPRQCHLSPLLCRRRVAAAHPTGAGGGHRHGRRLQRELGGLLRALREAAAGPPAAPTRLQPGAVRRGAWQPPGRAAGRRGGHGRQHRQHLRRRPHAGRLSPLGAGQRAGVRGAGHVAEAGGAPHPHPAGGARYVSPPLAALQSTRVFPRPNPARPLPRAGGVLCITYAVAVGTGISYFQHADIDSGRNVFIVGFTMFMALLVPRWLGAAPAHLATGWVPLDLLFLSLLTVPVFLTGFLSFFLENTVSGTLEERGLPQKAGAGDGERGEASPVYALPAGLSRLLPSCKAFPCCFLCPGREEEEEEEEKEEEDGEDGCRAAEEGVVATGEGTWLLLKPGTGEAQDREPSQAETLAWHTGA